MEMEPTNTDAVSDQELNTALEAHIAENYDGLSIESQRSARIKEYEESALSRLDPFAAVIAMGNASLQRIFEHLNAALLDELYSKAHTLEEMREISPEIRLLLKLRKSIETGFAFQLHDAEQHAATYRQGGRDKRTRPQIGSKQA